MSWRDQQMTIRRGRLAGLIFLGAVMIAAVALCLAVIVGAAFGTVPLELTLALVAVFLLCVTVSLGERASFYIRRAARRQRLRHR